MIYVTGQMIFIGYYVQMAPLEIVMIARDAPFELPRPLVLADHPVLDLLNTRMMVDGERCDLLDTEKAAIDWLEHVGLADAASNHPDKQGMLEQLRLLRDSVDELITARLGDRTADPHVLNEFMHTAVPQLVWHPAQPPHLERFQQPDATARLLARLAYAAAELLAEGDFSLVRHCESADCSLIFYDRTKSHKRRWCSMALCGNRHKVAEFRKRRQDQAR